LRSVGVYEAKAHLSKLLEDVAGGETIAITKHGVPVAYLAPTTRLSDQDASAAVEALLEFGRTQHITTGGMSIREMRDYGRP
jgi:prevent-host-death family protein